MIIKINKQIIALIGNFLLFVATVFTNPIFVAKQKKEWEIREGKVKCPRCLSSDIDVEIISRVECQVSEPLVDTEWMPDSEEWLKLTCKQCGAIM